MLTRAIFNSAVRRIDFSSIAMGREKVSHAGTQPRLMQPTRLKAFAACQDWLASVQAMVDSGAVINYTGSPLGARLLLNDLNTSLSLLARAVQSDSDAWHTITNDYGPLVYHWCRQSGLGPEDAADVMQNVFRSVSSSLSQFRKEKETDRFRAWLRTITKHKIIDFRRTQSEKPKASGGSVALELLNQIPDIEAGSTINESCLTAEMQTAVDSLKPTFKEKTWEAFWRVTVDGVAPQMVADQLEMQLDSVYQAKSRVLRKLRAALEK